jgi:hypothetical protein
MAFCTTCGASVNGAFCTQCGTPLSVAGQAAGAGNPPPQPPPMQAAPPPAAPPYSAAAPLPPPMAARKTSPLVWILVIVFGLFVLGGIAVVGTGLFVVHKVRQAGLDPDLMQHNPGLAVTKMLAAINPDVEVLNTDDGAGKITVRDRKTGKVVTMSFDDARNGRFGFSAQDESGKSATLEFGGSAGRVPSWIPSYPGSNPKMTFSASAADGDSGNFTFETSDEPARVMQFYQDKAKELGMNAATVMATERGGMVTGSDESSHHSMNVVVDGVSGKTTVAVTYGKK